MIEVQGAGGIAVMPQGAKAGNDGADSVGLAFAKGVLPCVNGSRAVAQAPSASIIGSARAA
jgi:hypothetical protein